MMSKIFIAQVIYMQEIRIFEAKKSFGDEVMKATLWSKARENIEIFRR